MTVIDDIEAGEGEGERSSIESSEEESSRIGAKLRDEGSGGVWVSIEEDRVSEDKVGSNDKT